MTVRGSAENGLTLLGCVFWVAYGAAVWWASIDGLQRLAGLSNFWAGALSFPLAYFPFVGQGVAFYGITKVWHWHWWWAALYLFWPVAIMLPLIAMGYLSQRGREKKLYREYVAKIERQHSEAGDSN